MGRRIAGPRPQAAGLPAAGGRLRCCAQPRKVDFAPAVASTVGVRNIAKCICAACVLVGLAAGAASAAEPPVLLGKPPTFEPGQTVTVRRAESSQTSMVDADGKLARTSQRLSAVLVQRVLAVKADDAGAVTSLRSTISQATRVVAPLSAKDKPDEVEISIRDVSVELAADAAGRLAPDTRTLTAAAATAKDPLTAPQIALVRQLLLRGGWAGWDGADALLLADKPVAPGQSWQAPQAALNQWCAAKPSLAGGGVKAASAELKLASLAGGVATITGRMKLTLRIDDADVAGAVDLTWRIDTRTGRWLSRISRSTADIPRQGRTQRLVVEREESMAYGTAASGPASGPASAATAVNIGWAAPAADSNSFHDEAAGVSLNPQVGAFAGPDGQSVAITSSDLGRPMDVDELVKLATGNLQRAQQGFVLKSATPITLADGVPAALLGGASEDGKLLVASVVALDGEHAASVIVTMPAGDEARAAQARAMLRTLRVFEPRLPAAAKGKP
jgi:hypothetical protein